MPVYGPCAESNKNYIFVGNKCAGSSTRNPPAIFKYYMILYIGTSYLRRNIITYINFTVKK